jgi:hypothetical protein
MRAKEQATENRKQQYTLIHFPILRLLSAIINLTGRVAPWEDHATSGIYLATGNLVSIRAHPSLRAVLNW